MDKWKSVLKGDASGWLLEESNPFVRYHALRWLLDKPDDDPEVIQTSQAIAASETIRKILKNQRPEGYWGSKPQAHSGTKNQLLVLTWLGYHDNGVAKNAMDYRIKGCLMQDGAYGLEYKEQWVFLPCHGSELLRQMLYFSYADDPRTRNLLNWLLRIQEPDGVWPCISKVKPFPCLWATGDVLRALDDLPASWNTPPVIEARRRTVELFLNSRLCYYKKIKPDKRWFQFGYPLQWDTDILEMLELVAAYVSPDDPRIQEGLKLILDKQDQNGRWPREKYPKGGLWIDKVVPQEQIGEPSKWVTLHAMSMLKRLYSEGKKIYDEESFPTLFLPPTQG